MSDSLQFTQKMYALESNAHKCVRSFLCNIAAQIQKQCVDVVNADGQANKGVTGIDVKPPLSSSKCYRETIVQLT